MGRPFIDLTGRKFGRLIVIDMYEKRLGYHVKWKCTYSSYDKEMVGCIGYGGMPYPAYRLPLGSIYTTILTMPDKGK